MGRSWGDGWGIGRDDEYRKKAKSWGDPWIDDYQPKKDAPILPRPNPYEPPYDDWYKKDNEDERAKRAKREMIRKVLERAQDAGKAAKKKTKPKRKAKPKKVAPKKERRTPDGTRDLDVDF